ncbi:retroviral-like aspartic protease family protein [Leptolyngbya sp. FACHB-541]|uniref:retropepsin-like aspartic protease family protein n=1 Tax=Leptolyngbya sp. FACHB-541 TaxID=2692810 RepID=UPI0016835176|nr:retropepsin-like aspartic protease [Leptolyngbya sp. FACHB-541]MBD1996763.1 retroviral-like aspartic protease family protein [Leptolyngbya sp. FACHB-541]
MRQFLRPTATLLLLSGCGIVSVACSSISGDRSSSISVQPATSPIASPAPVAPIASPAVSTPQPPDPYQQAISRASSAFTISQSARSQDDWRLVASRWQQAIDLLASVPAASPNRSLAQTKLSEYRRNLDYAQQQASRSTALANPDGVVVLAPRNQPVSQQPASQPVAPRPFAAAPAPASSGGAGVYQVPIVRRAGGTPVINVTFNGSRQFEMILDTGASGTVITSQMATALNVVPVGEASVDTASDRNVTFPLGYVNSIEVGGAIAQDVLVAVAGPNLGVGLLGQDFFSHYDVVVRQDVVEFRER